MKRGKKYTAASKLIEAKKEYTIAEASELVKTTSTVKFDATVELSMKLNVDTKANDQQVRGTLVLPHGNGKEKKVLVLTQNKLKQLVLILLAEKKQLKKLRMKTGLVTM